MKVLITGGAGFLGSHLADRLLSEGNEVLVLDNYETGRRENLTEQKGLTVVEGTIAERADVDTAFKDFDPDVVAHAAASYKDGEAWETDVQVNAMGTVNVIRASKEADVGRFIYFQTGLSYGINPSVLPVPLDHPQPGESSYAITKTTGENYVAMSGLDYVTFRLANIYGPRVEVDSDWFAEAVWAGRYRDGAFDRTDLVFGSGGRARSDCRDAKNCDSRDVHDRAPYQPEQNTQRFRI
jgi:UDP-glucose 4-epimerase